jgi:hypothetical protein
MTKIISLSLQKYILAKYRGWSLHECYISEQRKEIGMVNVFVAQKQLSGNISYGLFLLDLFCPGVKAQITSLTFRQESF